MTSSENSTPTFVHSLTESEVGSLRRIFTFHKSSDEKNTSEEMNLSKSSIELLLSDKSNKVTKNRGIGKNMDGEIQNIIK